MQSRRRRKKAGGGRCGKTSEAKPVFGQTVPIEDADGAPVSGNRGNTANGGRSAPRWERGRCAGRLGCGLFILTFKAISCAASRSEEHTSELQSLMRISYAVFCLKKKKTNRKKNS